jgi:hypothetical protein
MNMLRAQTKSTQWFEGRKRTHRALRIEVAGECEILRAVSYNHDHNLQNAMILNESGIDSTANSRPDE